LLRDEIGQTFHGEPPGGWMCQYLRQERTLCQVDMRKPADTVGLTFHLLEGLE
jgi:hypothetical protein